MDTVDTLITSQRLLAMVKLIEIVEIVETLDVNIKHNVLQYGL